MKPYEISKNGEGSLYLKGLTQFQRNCDGLGVQNVEVCITVGIVICPYELKLPFVKVNALKPLNELFEIEFNTRNFQPCAETLTS
jgi:hypothetical protein